MNNIFTVVIGDWSNDGHGRFDTFIIETNYDKDTLVENYKRSKELLGIDPEEDFCVEYEDSTISDKDLRALRDHGFDSKYIDTDGGTNYVEPRGYLDIIMFFYGLGIPDFEWQVDEFPELHAGGGYGLYYS